MKAWLKKVDQFWFPSGSPVALGVFRIIFGLISVASLAITALSYNMWFTERGFVPAALGNRYLPAGLPKNFSFFGATVSLPFELPRLNVLSGVTNDTVTLIVFSLTLLTAILTTLGLWTRLSTILLAIGVVSLHHRNGLILHGGDTTMRVGVLYLALAPCGRACSVDRLIGLWKGTAPAIPSPVPLWSQKLIAYNCALVYFTTFWHKLGYGGLWRNMTATYYPAHIAEFKRFWVPEFFNQPPMIYFTTAFTLLIELALGTVVFYKPWRNYVILGGLALHGYIEWSMNIPLFAFTICAMYICFYSGEEISASAKKLGERLKRWKLTYFLPKGAKIAPEKAPFLQAMDPLGLVQFEPGEATTLGPTRGAWLRSIGAWAFGPLYRRWLQKSLQEPAK
jgi:hypothetical protein